MPDTQSVSNTSGAVPIATLPTQITSAQQGAGVDTLNKLLDYRKGIDSQIADATKAAMVPVSGSGAGTSAGLMLNPVPAFQETPLISKRTAGARSTRDQGIANTIIASANIVGKYETQKRQDNQRVLAVDLERVMQSTQGINEAQTALQDAQEQLKANPNDPQAKAAVNNAQTTLKKNQDIINSLLSDPKKRKLIGKALDINFTDPSANSTEEHGALKTAVASYTQQLQKATPAQMQPNQAAINKLQLLTGQQKSVDELIKSIAGPTITGEYGVTKTGIQQGQENARTSAKLATDWDIHLQDNQAKYKTAMDVATKNNNTRMAIATKQIQGALDRTNANIDNRMKMLKYRENDPRAQSVILTGIINAENGQIKTIKSQMDRNDLLFANDKLSKDDYDSMQTYLKGLSDSIQIQATAQTDHVKDLAGVEGKEDNSDGESTNSTSDGVTNEPVPTKTGPEQDSDADTNPDDYN